MEYKFIARVQETHACDDSMSAGATTVVEFDLMHGAQCVETRMSVRAPTSFCHRDVGARLMRKTAACLSMKEPNPDRARLAPDPTTAQVGKVDALRRELFRFKSAASSVQRASALSPLPTRRPPGGPTRHRFSTLSSCNHGWIDRSSMLESTCVGTDMLEI